jgi:hypothetical protein
MKVIKRCLRLQKKKIKSDKKGLAQLRQPRTQKNKAILKSIQNRSRICKEKTLR